jgi:hypothetical protein
VATCVKSITGSFTRAIYFSEYNAENRTGPAIWLKCVIANTLEDIELPDALTPIIYIPGVSRNELRAIELCPDSIKPLAELQYRGVMWSQHNGKDWTANAFLASSATGLGLDVSKDKATQDNYREVIFFLYPRKQMDQYNRT